MATPSTTKERLVVIEEQLAQNSREHVELKDTLVKINDKLDCAISGKADKSALDSLTSKMWGVVATIIAAFVSLIVWLVQKN